MVILTNPFFENFPQLRKDWKGLRNTLTSDLDDRQHLERVVSWWSRAPISRDWLNWDDPGSWPDPWELIATKNLDNSAISLGMGYTLILGQDGRWNSDRVQMRLACDKGKTMQHLVVAVDGRFALNFEYSRVYAMDNDIISNSIYRFDGKKYHEVDLNKV